MFLSVLDVAKRWQTTQQFVYKLIAKGELPALKMGSVKKPVVRVPLASLEQYEATQLVGAK